MKAIAQLCLLSAVTFVPGFSAGGGPSPATEAQEETRIDITIRDSTFILDRPVASQPGIPTVIILRNQDIVRHGFTSTMFRGVLVRAQGEGIAAYGRSLDGFYIDAGKTLVLRMTVDEAGRHTFRCDLHPAMKGEVLVIDMGTA